MRLLIEEIRYLKYSLTIGFIGQHLVPSKKDWQLFSTSSIPVRQNFNRFLWARHYQLSFESFKNNCCTF